MSRTTRAVFLSAVLGGLTQCAMPVAANTVYVDPNARLLACYQEVVKPAEFYVHRELVKKAEKKYIRRNDRVELIENPAIYKEHRTLKSPRAIVLEEIPCD